MSLEDNIHSIEHVREALNAKNWDRCLRFYSDSVAFSGPNLSQPITGRSMLLDYFKNLAAAFPDFRIEELDIFGRGERVCAEVIFVGTHTGHLPGPGGKMIPPTNRRIRYPLVLIFKLEGGRIVRERGYFDVLGMMAQLGQ
ncbi:MAG: ester cyclase [Thermoplasmata archaeon]